MEDNETIFEKKYTESAVAIAQDLLTNVIKLRASEQLLQEELTKRTNDFNNAYQAMAEANKNLAAANEDFRIKNKELTETLEEIEKQRGPLKRKAENAAQFMEEIALLKKQLKEKDKIIAALPLADPEGDQTAGDGGSF